ncbi:MAG: phage portal protein, partial [Syntrophorhabdaceae bacterium]|nr:phage portal protein [Syntrophorhabdaceae bacterium]
MKNFLSRLFFKIFKRQILKAASKERLYKKFTTKERGPNETLPELSIVRARANNLYLNDPFIYGAVNTIINRAIGPGSTLQAQTESEAFNTAIESAFADWARVADYYRQFHFGDIQRICFKKLFLDGGIFIRFIHNPKDPISHFGVELIEYSSLATDLMGTNITSGVETNNDGIVLAYYFRKPNGTILKVNADDVLHFTYERRPGQL